MFSLADLMWRKIRAQKYLQAVLLNNTLDPRCPFFDEAYGLCNFRFVLLTEPELAFEKYADGFLLPDKVKHLKEKFPRSNYQSTLEWARAVRHEIETVLLPAITRLEAPEPYENVETGLEESLAQAAEMQMGVAIFHSKDLFEDELNLRERLDAMIDRNVKHLIQLKAMKQMLRQTGALREDEQPRKIAAPRRIAAPTPPTIDNE